MTCQEFVPWEWKPTKKFWFHQLYNLAKGWNIHEDLEVDSNLIHNELVNAILSEEEWLYHPCINALTFTDGRGKLQRDFQLIMWLAKNCRRSLRTIIIPQKLWLWNTEGGREIMSGKYDVMSLIQKSDYSYVPNPISLDVWADSIGVSFNGNWAEKLPLNDQDENILKNDIRVFYSASELLKSLLPECFDWINSVTKIVIPLTGNNSKSLRSGTRPDIPGSVRMDLGGEMYTMELLVHESAHLQFFLSEVESDIVDPIHNETYWSPLKKEERPLRGIFLAYHALVHICGFYRDAMENKLISKEAATKETTKLIEQMMFCEKIIESAKQHLTPKGIIFFEKSKQVAHYALS